MEEKIVEYVTTLFATFGYWFIAAVGAVTLIMIPVNLLIKRIFKSATSESVIRVRKTLSSAMVFVVSGGVIAVATLIFKKPLSINYVLVNCIPCGALAMLLWAVVKIVRDVGFKPILAKILHSKTIKKALADIDIDKDVKKMIYNKLCEIVENTSGDNSALVVSKVDALTEKAKSLLNGFVVAENIAEYAQKFVSAVQLTYISK